MPNILSHEIELTPAFHDLDPMDVVWHGNFLRYFELARCALLQQIDYDYPQMRESGFAWPIIDIRVKYVRPLRYGQSIIVRATFAEWEHRLKIHYEARDAASGQRLTRGYSIQVAVDMATQEMLYASPPVLLQRLGVQA